MRPANCPNCHGNGRVLDESRPVTEYDLPQYRNCAYCGGSGFDMPPWDYRYLLRPSDKTKGSP